MLSQPPTDAVCVCVFVRCCVSHIHSFLQTSINRARLRRRRTLERIRFHSSSNTKPSESVQIIDDDMTSIERDIARIIDAMLPFVREHANAMMCDERMLVDMRTRLIEHVHRVCFPNGNHTDLFEHQLTSIIDDTFAKYSTLRYRVQQRLFNCLFDDVID